jgi:hypothetical protein
MYEYESPLVETIDNEGDQFDLDEDDSELSEGGQTEGSASEYEGDLKERPFMMKFASRECQVKFASPLTRKLSSACAEISLVNVPVRGIT